MSTANTSPALELWLQGIGCWTPELADWPAMRAWLQGGAAPEPGAAGKPKPQLLSPAERRRAPLGVRVAVAVASEAVAMAGHEAAELPSLFSCAHGDVGILDNICATLAAAPSEVSPTRFHNSVHNAAAGYWTMASSCHAASSAMTALDYSFASGLLEAASRVVADATPMLLVASDGPGCGALAEVIASRQWFGCALVLAPQPSANAVARLTLCLVDPGPPALAGRARALADANLSARGLPLLDAVANGKDRTMQLPLAPRLALDVAIDNKP